MEVDASVGTLMAINIGCDSINNDTTLQEVSPKASAKDHLVPLNVLFALRNQEKNIIFTNY